MWYENNNILRIKKTENTIDKVVVRLYSGGQFVQSCVIPTIYYPLNGKPEIFTCQNTEKITDKKVLEIFDSICYERHECYSNTEKLVNELRKAGYNAKSYFGWFFQESDAPPIHHAWCVLNNSILDLSDHWTLIENSDAYKEIFGNKKGRIGNEKEFVEIGKIISTFENQYSNATRCSPVGVPTERFVYVGSPCAQDIAVKILHKLKLDYPEHGSFQYGKPYKNLEWRD